MALHFKAKVPILCMSSPGLWNSWNRQYNLSASPPSSSPISVQHLQLMCDLQTCWSRSNPFCSPNGGPITKTKVNNLGIDGKVLFKYQVLYYSYENLDIMYALS